MNDNQELFWTLLKPEYTRAAQFCRKLTGDRDSGDDLLQDGLVTALEKFETLRDKGAFRPWLYRILINCFRATVRRPWWRRRLPMSPAVEAGMIAADPTDCHAARRLLRFAFEKISTGEQALVTLHELEQWSIAELAQFYGTTAGAIKTRLHRARTRMKKAIIARSDQLKSEIETDGENDRCVAVKPKKD